MLRHLELKPGSANIDRTPAGALAGRQAGTQRPIDIKTRGAPFLIHRTSFTSTSILKPSVSNRLQQRQRGLPPSNSGHFPSELSMLEGLEEVPLPLCHTLRRLDTW